jgi:hypothetical protein
LESPIDGQTIISDRKGFSGGESTDVVTKEVPQTELVPGVHEFELFTYSFDILNFPTFQVRVKIRSENSANPTILDAKRVFHRPESLAPNQPSGSQTNATLRQDNAVPGAKLEVWALPSDFRGETPPSMSLGSIIDSGTLFNRFVEEL